MRLARPGIAVWSAVAAGVVAGAATAAIGLVVVGDDDGPRLDEIEAVVREVVDDALVARDERIPTAAAAVMPGVVIIDAEAPAERDEFGNLVARASVGSGLVLDREGHILTNEHVIRDTETIMVILADGRRFPAEVVGTDAPFTDVAVLRIEEQGLAPAPFGSSSALRFGETVLSVGNPLLGSEASVTVGVVSDPDTYFPRENFVQEHLIQTDAALNQGNSGGALVSLRGEVVGLTTTVIRETEAGSFVDGVGFALQMDVVLPIARAIALAGRYDRPDLGVVDERTVTRIAAAQLGLPVERGSFLLEITRNGPLAATGIRPGDILLSLDGHEIDADQPFLNVLALLTPGDPVEVVYLQNGESEERRATVIPEVRQR